MRAGYQQSGFTLIEAVISVLLLAVMSIMSYQAVETVLLVNERSQTDLAEEIRLQRAWQIIGNDLLHLRSHSYDDGLGGIEPAYETGRSEALVNFSRGGGPLMGLNPTGQSRIRYQLNEDNELIRNTWPVFLSPRDYDSQPQVILTDVSVVFFEQLTDENIYSPNWPPLNQTLDLSTLPRMIRVTIELADGSSTWRLFPGVENGS